MTKTLLIISNNLKSKLKFHPWAYVASENGITWAAEVNIPKKEIHKPNKNFFKKILLIDVVEKKK